MVLVRGRRPKTQQIYLILSYTIRGVHSMCIYILQPLVYSGKSVPAMAGSTSDDDSDHDIGADVHLPFVSAFNETKALRGESWPRLPIWFTPYILLT